MMRVRQSMRAQARVAAIVALLACPVARAQELPAGKGKALVQSACTQCHGSDVIVIQRHTRDEWTEVVSRMIGNGAQLTDGDFKTSVDYLEAHFGRTGPAAPAGPIPSRARRGGK